jgi:hypothetical protein
MPKDNESLRIEARDSGKEDWHLWGSYLSDRQWGTVREDYSADGDAWTSFSFDQSRSRAYRWGEDGLLGICDKNGLLCFSAALWNGKDPILKERAFGLSNPQGNHGEDIKDYYYHLANTPTHSFMRGLYKYPQQEFPYQHLIEENGRRSRLEREYELVDTGIFNESRYFDVFFEYAKAAPDDMAIRLRIINRGPGSATYGHGKSRLPRSPRSVFCPMAKDSAHILPSWAIIASKPKASRSGFSPKTRPTTADSTTLRTARLM